ncbi:hypothetical protein BABINDRAFT_161273 [Babjeviella inositovora NRRL Y-12698]|uniref:Uncharacterized protein n=1 Tax=Babjeviella inositovora NRRL Y-12698 TaxID=984486 RepID=A0A1E3QRQ6_9ASCO|nr:uncharacterized protein BABINDRAFT_161273 [Babjeviella inositovora NRRL Y-12698]ODQ80318.1 hypothetical protein BABINDRAFT_161273 [Babjeviella inositovora NRRL Y-12698]
MSLKEKLRTKFTRTKSLLKMGDDEPSLLMRKLSTSSSSLESETASMSPSEDYDDDLDPDCPPRLRNGSLSFIAMPSPLSAQTIREVEEEYVKRHTRDSSTASSSGLSCIPEDVSASESNYHQELSQKLSQQLHNTYLAESAMDPIDERNTSTPTIQSRSPSPLNRSHSPHDSSFDTTLTIQGESESQDLPEDPHYFSNKQQHGQEAYANLSSDDLLPPIPMCPPSTEEELSPTILPNPLFKRPLSTPPCAPSMFGNDECVSPITPPSFHNRASYGSGNSTSTTLSSSNSELNLLQVPNMSLMLAPNMGLMLAPNMSPNSSTSSATLPMLHEASSATKADNHDYADAMASTILEKVSRSASVSVHQSQVSVDNFHDDRKSYDHDTYHGDIVAIQDTNTDNWVI